MNKIFSILLISPFFIFSCAQQVRINVVNSDENKGNVTQGGNFTVNSTIILEAKPKEGYLFSGWYNDNAVLSFQNPYIYTVPKSDITITARWEDYSTQSFNFDDYGDSSWSISHFRGTSDKDKNVIIPKTHYGRNVVAIGAATFAHDRVMENISIHDDIIKIGDYAFEDVKLSTITLPINLKEVSDNAFITWKDTQTIKIYESSMLQPKKVTKWGWELKDEQTYYTCTKSGSAHILLI